MINRNKLMKISYYDSKSEVRLEAYADTVVLEKVENGNINYVVAMRMGGYPESVRGLAEAVFGGGSISLELEGQTLTVNSFVKQYRREYSHDGIYAEATLMI